MNNKLIGYEEAKERLKAIEMYQIFTKSAVRNVSSLGKCSAKLQSEVHKVKEEINMLLSIIHAHKQARKYYGKLKDEQKKIS